MEWSIPFMMNSFFLSSDSSSIFWINVHLPMIILCAWIGFFSSELFVVMNMSQYLPFLKSNKKKLHQRCVVVVIIIDYCFRHTIIKNLSTEQDISLFYLTVVVPVTNCLHYPFYRRSYNVEISIEMLFRLKVRARDTFFDIV